MVDEISQREELCKQYLSLITGAYNYPSFGINVPTQDDLRKFAGNLISEGYIDCEDVDEAIDDYQIPIFISWLLWSRKISIVEFVEFITGTNYGTSVMNYKEVYKGLIDNGVIINER